VSCTPPETEVWLCHQLGLMKRDIFTPSQSAVSSVMSPAALNSRSLDRFRDGKLTKRRATPATCG